MKPLSLPVKLTLALISGYGVWPLEFAAEPLDDALPLPIDFLSWGHILIGGLFGALVMAPLVTSGNLRFLRAVALCICSIITFWLAIAVLSEVSGITQMIATHKGLKALLDFVAAGLVGAELVVISVIVFAPIKASWRIFVLAALAGSVGGAIVEHTNNVALYEQSSEFLETTGIAAWQVLVCLALHFGTSGMVRRPETKVV